jgi:hypothetical protein
VLVGRKPASRVEAALDELSAYGFVLSPGAQRALLRDPPRTEEGFVNAVFAQEGLGSPDPPDLVGLVRDIVREWLFDGGEGKGTRSGLPYTFIEDGD